MSRHSKKSPAAPASRSVWGYFACALGGGVLGAAIATGILHDELPRPPAGLPTSVGSENTNAAPSFPGLPPPQRAVQRGNWAYDQQRWTEAISYYEEALRLGADNADVRTDLGNAYRFTNQPLQALEQYRVAQAQNPSHENSLLNTGRLYQQVLNDPVKARASLEQFVVRFPSSPALAQARQALTELGASEAALPAPKVAATSLPAANPVATPALALAPTPSTVSPVPVAAVAIPKTATPAPAPMQVAEVRAPAVPASTPTPSPVDQDKLKAWLQQRAAPTTKP